MKINRNNYEAFLLDLSEGNLSDELRSELNSFLASNPDLDVELIDEFSIVDDQEIEAIDKDLLKFDTINESNKNYFFIAYHEGDLKISEQNEVLEYISKDSKLKQEFNQFARLKLKSSNEIFKDKKSLHSNANSNSSRGLMYWSFRVAAMLLIGFFINALYQNANNITPKYTLTKDISNLEPAIQHGEALDFTASIESNATEELNDINTLVVYNDIKNESALEDTMNIQPLNSKQEQENLSTRFDKKKITLLKRNLALDKVTASLNQSEDSEENEIIESLSVKKIKTPPSLLAYLGEKAKEKKILTESGSPNIVSLLNRGSSSLTGRDVLAKSQTEQSNSTIFQLGGLKIERISNK